jgi:hypothetical protein
MTRVGRILRQGAAALIDVATDESTVAALDRLAGPRWRLAAQAADVAVVAARAAVRGATEPEPDAQVDTAADAAEAEGAEAAPAAVPLAGRRVTDRG